MMSLSMTSGPLEAKDIDLTGQVTDETGAYVANARVTFMVNTTEFGGYTGTDGRYTVRISGQYSDVAGDFQVSTPFPNPFSASVNIPFIINSGGDIRFTVFNLAGQKITDILFPSVSSGSYRLIWDGCNPNGSPVRPGFYVYGITFKGKTYGGRLIKAEGYSSYDAETGLQPIDIPPESTTTTTTFRLPVIAQVTKSGYYPVRMTDITVETDTVIDFHLALRQEMPFKVSGDHIAMHTTTGYKSLILKGINLGSSPPGYFPGEIAYAISADHYEQWIAAMAGAGFNCIRIYTLHPPVFYEKLAEYNQRHPDHPLLLFQGIWLEEVEDASNPQAYDLINREASFSKEIEEVVSCINGHGNIAFRYGKAYGIYSTDVSRWTAGYIIGREVSPEEIDTTDVFHQGLSTYSGSNFSISGGTPSEVFIAKMMDKVATYEAASYSSKRPVSFSSWPTLDPMEHPTEIHTTEDVASVDIMKISAASQSAGFFASYHAYPYYPNFISQEPGYQAYSDSYGPDSYLGYVTALKNHYNSIPLVMAEFGVPSSWGSGHESYSNMPHGGLSEIQQGEKNVRMLHNILDAGCAGGFMFVWTDEWFKRTWIVAYLEAYGFKSGSVTIPTIQLWHNEVSPEQNFGLLAYDQADIPDFENYMIDKPSGPVSTIRATHDDSYFYLNVVSADNYSSSDKLMIAFDTYLGETGESQLPGAIGLGNRAEFMLSVDLSEDSSQYNVTQAYDMFGLTMRFDHSDHDVQKYKSIVSDGAPWKLMRWENDGFEYTIFDIGRLPVEHAQAFSEGNRAAVAWYGNTMRIRIPWTMLYFFDPTQMTVNNGAVSYDGGYNYDILTTSSDGIAVSVLHKGVVTNTTNRYSWSKWLVVPPTRIREKASFQIVADGLSGVPDFAE